MSATGPLSGVRVVALEQAVAGPMATRHLADLGADVIKIERPGEGDFARHYDGNVKGLSTNFVWLNRGKRSLTLNVKDPDAIAALQKLVGSADVMIQNLGPGAADRLGLGPKELSKTYPKLIYCSISGYGEDGPYRDRKAYDLLIQGETAMIFTSGTAEQPAKIGVSVSDISAGMYAFSAILAALYERERTGRGRALYISLFDTSAEWMSVPLYHHMYTGRPLSRAGLHHNLIVPYGPYRCGGDEMINLAVQNERQWRNLCDAIDRPDIAVDPRFNSNKLRTENRLVLEPLLEEVLTQWDRAEVVRRLEASDVPFGEVNDTIGLAEHPQLEERGRWVDVDSEAGEIKLLKLPIVLDEELPAPSAIPAVGEHTSEVLAELGYSDDEIGAMRERGAV
ncbi:MAG: CoA transferase [Dehalococcoidia bacterium]|nr:CoA transferase [Dehalococcoidia bacterium]